MQLFYMLLYAIPPKPAPGAPPQRFYCFLYLFCECRAQRGICVFRGKRRAKQISGIYIFSWVIINSLRVFIFKIVYKSRVVKTGYYKRYI